MAQENNVMTLSSLRNDRTFATISQFFHTFQSAFSPWPNYAESQWSSILHRPPSSRMKSDAAQDDYLFSTEDLEDMLMDTGRRYQLEELITRMLRLLTRNRFVSTSTWQEYFSREWDRREHDLVNPFYVVENSPPSQPLTAATAITNNQTVVTQNENMTTESGEKNRSFFDLPMETRLALLNTLCEWQLDDPERLREHMDNDEDTTQWRVDPIGCDAKGNTFWLFDDNRLYKEAAPLPKKKAMNRKRKKPMSQSTRRNIRRSTRATTTNISEPDENFENVEEDEEEWTAWKLLCMTVDEWQRFPQKYSKSNHPQDQQFYQLLVDDVLPKVIPVIEEHEKDRKKQEAIVYRKRSSRILVRELEALEHHQAASNDVSSQQPSLSRSEQRRLQKEAEEKERQTKAREERILERERKLFEKVQAEERAAEKARLDREHRLQRRLGDVPIDIDGDVDIMIGQDSSLQQQDFKLILTVADPNKKSTIKSQKKVAKEKIKKNKGSNDPTLGKRKRGRKPKVRPQEDDESWTFNCTCGVFGKNFDDGTPMIACERCNEWQHINCLRGSSQVDTQLTSFDDLTFICRRCTEKEAKEAKEEIHVDDTNTTDEQLINTKIQNAIPAPPDTYTQPSSSLTYATTTVTNNAPQYNPYLPPMVQSSERHILHQPIRSPHSLSYALPFKPDYPPQTPNADLNRNIMLPSFDRRTTSYHNHQQYHHQQQHQQHQQQQQQQQQQQRTLDSLPQHYSHPPMELDHHQASILSSSSSSQSPFTSVTTKNTIVPPTNPSMVTIGNDEAIHKTTPPLNKTA